MLAAVSTVLSTRRLPNETETVLVVSPVELLPQIRSVVGKFLRRTAFHTLLCANTLLPSQKECPHQHHKVTYAMICNFTDIVLVNAITQSHPHHLDENTPPTKQKNVCNFSHEPFHQSNKKATPCYAPAITSV